MNADKSKLLVTRNDENVSLIVDNETIHGRKTVKLLGIRIDNRSLFTEHISNICNKVSMKLHASWSSIPYHTEHISNICKKVSMKLHASWSSIPYHTEHISNICNKVSMKLSQQKLSY